MPPRPPIEIIRMNLKGVVVGSALASLAMTMCVRTALPQKGRAATGDLASIQRRLERSELAGLDSELMALAVANPSDPRTMELLARLRFKEGRLAESRALYRRVLEIDPKSVSARINSARIEFRFGQPGEAARLLDGVVTGNKLISSLQLELAATYLLIGDANSALTVVEGLPPAVKSTTGLPLIGEIYLRLGRRDALIGMVPAMKKAAARNASLAVRCGEVLRGAGLIREAIGVLTALPPSTRNNIQVLVALARLEVVTENPTKAAG